MQPEHPPAPPPEAGRPEAGRPEPGQSEVGPSEAGEAVTINDVLAAFEGDGFASQFAARAGALVECLTCHQAVEPKSLEVDHFRRLEGASDPDDMVAVVAMTCPHCGARGTLVLGYGPASSEEDASVLAGIDEPPPPDAERAI